MGRCTPPHSVYAAEATLNARRTLAYRHLPDEQRWTYNVCFPRGLCSICMTKLLPHHGQSSSITRSSKVRVFIVLVHSSLLEGCPTGLYPTRC